MAIDLTGLESEITRNKTIDGSAKVLIAGLIVKIEATKGDPAKVAELVAALKADNDDLAAAITANTPAEEGGGMGGGMGMGGGGTPA